MRAGALAAALAALLLGCGAAQAMPLFAGDGSSHPLVSSELERLLRIGLPVYCGGDRGRLVALTFDDGPGPYTALALRILRRAGARATFFLVGREAMLRPRLVPQEARLAALGDHTWTHPFLPELPRAKVERELAATKRLLERLSHRRVLFFRPPYGAHTASVDATARKLRMIEVLWSIDSRDSEGALWKLIGRTVLRAIRPGSVVLLHENRGQAIRALKFVILPALRRRRFHPVTLTQLLAADPPTLAQLRAGSRGCGSPSPLPGE